jgi:hypothetical protein
MDTIHLTVTAHLINRRPGQETPQWEIVPEADALIFKPEGMPLKLRCDLALAIANHIEVIRVKLSNQQKGNEVPPWSTVEKLHL